MTRARGAEGMAMAFYALLLLLAPLWGARARENICQNYVTGVVFLDYNGNGVQEPDEPYTSGMVGLVRDGQLYAEKEADEYGFIFENVPCGVYQVLLDGAPITEVTVDAVSPPLALALPKQPWWIFLPYVSRTP